MLQMSEGHLGWVIGNLLPLLGHRGAGSTFCGCCLRLLEGMYFSGDVSHEYKEYWIFNAGFLSFDFGRRFLLLVIVLHCSSDLSFNIFLYFGRNELRVGSGRGKSPE